MKRHALAVLGYLVATFATQALSHFLIFASHYAQVGYMKEPIFPLGLSSMLVQGTILSFVYTQSRFIDQGIKGAVQCAWLFGAFLVSYIALAEAAKYSVPSVGSWIAVEAGVGSVQFSLAGLLLGWAHTGAGGRPREYQPRRD